MKPQYLKYAMAGICLLFLTARLGHADVGATSTLVSPATADAIASPLTYLTVQTKREPDPGQFKSFPAVTYGLDSYFRSDYKLFDIPVTAVLTPDLTLQLDVPFAVAPASATDSSSEVQLGDILLSLKYRTDVDQNYDAYFILTARLPSGKPASSYGGGSYDFSFTHKSVFTCGGYRTTLMAGITLPPPFDFDVHGNSVVYAPNVAYMAATERPITNTAFTAGFKLAGLHAFGSRINTELQKNSLTSLDAIPEVSYRFREKNSVTLGVIVPVLTWYELPGAENSRNPIINLSVNGVF